MSVLKEKQDKLADVESQIAKLQASYEASVNEKEALTKDMSQTAARLKRAGKLTTALGDEQGRWQESVLVSQSLCLLFPNTLFGHIYLVVTTCYKRTISCVIKHMLEVLLFKTKCLNKFSNIFFFYTHFRILMKCTYEDFLLENYTTFCVQYLILCRSSRKRLAM